MDLSLHWSGDWPEHLEPLLEALAALPEAGDAAPGAVALCPDALAFRPPAGAAVGLVPDVTALLDPIGRIAATAAVELWGRAGAILLTPTEYGARLLRSVPGVDDRQVRHVPLPLPAGRVPHAWADGGDVVVLHPEARDAVLAAAGPLSLAGLHPRIVLVGEDAERFARPGGPAGAHGLLGGVDVLATDDPAQIAAHAGVVVLGESGSGIGWVLRQVLATARPVVAPSSWLVRDHLTALGTSAYLHAGDPASVAVALAGALRRSRGARLGEAARAAVQGESWSVAARGVLAALELAATGALAAAPAPVSTVSSYRVSPGGERLAIDFVNPRPSGGGGERFLRCLAGAIADHPSRPRVRVVCGLAPGVAFDPGVAELRASGVEVVAVLDPAPEAITAELGDADVVYCSWPHMSEPLATAAPLVCTYHDLNFLHFDVYGAAERALLSAQTPRWIERCAAMVHSSPFIAEEMREHFDVPDGLAHVIELAAEPPAAAAPAARAAVRARHGLGDAPFLLSPNGNHLHKNYAALFAALRRLRADGRPVRVLATGFATERFHGPDLIGLGYVPAGDLAALYAEARGIVQTTLYEAGSFPMMEAMAAGKPVAVSAIAPVTEQIARRGLTAETFDPCVPAAVAEAVWRVWNGGPATQPQVLEANRAAICARTWQDVAADYLAVLTTAASRVPALAVGSG